jgi:hypothetical protein
MTVPFEGFDFRSGSGLVRHRKRMGIRAYSTPPGAEQLASLAIALSEC